MSLAWPSQLFRLAIPWRFQHYDVGTVGAVLAESWLRGPPKHNIHAGAAVFLAATSSSQAVLCGWYP